MVVSAADAGSRPECGSAEAAGSASASRGNGAMDDPTPPAEPPHTLEERNHTFAAGDSEAPCPDATIVEPCSDQVNPQEFLDDVVNMVQDYLADGYDALEEFIMANVPMDSETSTLLKKGVQELYVHTKRRLEDSISAFEVAAKDQCFVDPAELPVAAQPCDLSGTGAGAVEEGGEADLQDEKALDSELKTLRRGIALNRAAVKQMRKDTGALELDISRHGKSSDLQAVVNGVDLREVCEGAQVLADGALRLRPLLSRAEQMRSVQLTDHNPETANITAAKAINKRKMDVCGATIEDLRRLRQAFGRDSS